MLIKKNSIYSMNILKIEETKHTPFVLLDAEQNILRIEGRSLPENTGEFYKNILLWIGNYMQESPKKTSLIIDLDYFNTASAKALFSIFRKLEALHEISQQVDIVWYYDIDDEDMKETGEDFQKIFKIPTVLQSK